MATPCLQKKARLAKQVQVPDLLTKYRWPDFTAMPDPAYLVFGSNPFENKKGRNFYDDEQYYLLDIVKPPEGAKSDRYIAVNLHNKNKSFKNDKLEVYDRIKTNHALVFFCESFNTIIFDFSTLKMFDDSITRHENGSIYDSLESMITESLMKFLKPGGVLILDGTEPSGHGIPKNLLASAKSQEEADALLANFREGERQKFIKRIRDFGFGGDIRTFAQIIKEFPETAPVYEPLIASGYASPDREVLILRHAGGAAAGAGGRWRPRTPPRG